jgi:hypothetical protein
MLSGPRAGMAAAGRSGHGPRPRPARAPTAHRRPAWRADLAGCWLLAPTVAAYSGAGAGGSGRAGLAPGAREYRRVKGGQTCRPRQREPPRQEGRARAGRVGMGRRHPKLMQLPPAELCEGFWGLGGGLFVGGGGGLGGGGGAAGARARARARVPAPPPPGWSSAAGRPAGQGDRRRGCLSENEIRNGWMRAAMQRDEMGWRRFSDVLQLRVCAAPEVMAAGALGCVCVAGRALRPACSGACGRRPGACGVSRAARPWARARAAGGGRRRSLALAICQPLRHHARALALCELSHARVGAVVLWAGWGWSGGGGGAGLGMSG